MTHECINLKCGHAVFNNTPGPRTCPRCDSPMISYFDEESEDNYPEDDMDRLEDQQRKIAEEE